MRRPESPERDAALEALVAGGAADPDLWSVTALRRHAGDEADLLFPGGGPDMVEAWCDLVDRRMRDEADAHGIADLPRVSERVRAAMLLRLPAGAPAIDVARRALAVLGRPGQAARAARVLARTADAIWRAAGDTSDGWPHRTRRLTAGGVWSATLLYAFAHPDDGDAIAAFLDRRLDGVSRVGRLRRRLRGGPPRTGGPAPP